MVKFVGYELIGRSLQTINISGDVHLLLIIMQLAQQGVIRVLPIQIIYKL
jgi:hypothetical protein